MVALEQPMNYYTAVEHTHGMFFNSVSKTDRHVFSGFIGKPRDFI